MVIPGKYKLWGRRMQEKMDQWINWVEYDELLAGHHNAPHNLLGLHEFGKGQVFTVYRPEAQKITVTDKNGKHALELEEIQEGSGFLENTCRIISTKTVSFTYSIWRK